MISFNPIMINFITHFFLMAYTALKKKLHMQSGNLIHFSEMLQNQIFRKRYASFVKFQQEIVIQPEPHKPFYSFEHLLRPLR